MNADRVPLESSLAARTVLRSMAFSCRVFLSINSLVGPLTSGFWTQSALDPLMALGLIRESTSQARLPDHGTRCLRDIDSTQGCLLIQRIRRGVLPCLWTISWMRLI